MTIAGEIADAIDSTAAAPDKARLTACLPMLTEAVDNWGPYAVPPGIVVAAATPRGAVVLRCDGLPELADSGLDKSYIAAAVAVAIETNQPDSIVAGLSLLLGKAGVTACIEDVERITRTDGQPLVVLLINHQEHSVASLVTVAELAPRSLH